MAAAQKQRNLGARKERDSRKPTTGCCAADELSRVDVLSSEQKQLRATRVPR